jgi:hypothetical protein
VESAAGVGSQFHFTMVFSKAAEGAENALEPAALEEVRGLRVLIIDDNDTNRCILGKMVERWQMQPLEAASGAEGLTKLHESVLAGHSDCLVCWTTRCPPWMA